MTTTLALVPLPSGIMDHAEAFSFATLRTTEAIWPASILQCRMALLLRPKGLNEIGEGKPFLVLDSVLGHLIVQQWFISTTLSV
jgi:hypothetical protein